MERRTIAALLPHVDVFGGVRRYLELGNALARRGHRFVLFTPQGMKPDWIEFRPEVRRFSDLAAENFDIGLCGEYSILPDFGRLRAAAKFFYFVLEGRKGEDRVVRQEGLRFLGNSEGICLRIERKYGVPCFRAPGGVNLESFHPQAEAPRRDTFNILCYGRIFKRRKGVHFVIRAVEGLARRNPRLRLVFFDTRVGLDRRDPRPLIRTKVPFDFHLDLPRGSPGLALRPGRYFRQRRTKGGLVEHVRRSDGLSRSRRLHSQRDHGFRPGRRDRPCCALPRAVFPPSPYSTPYSR